MFFSGELAKIILEISSNLHNILSLHTNAGTFANSAHPDEMNSLIRSCTIYHSVFDF